MIYIFEFYIFELHIWIFTFSSWPTKYTAAYVTFEGQKLRGQFSEFLFNSGGKISKEKRKIKVLRIKS